MPPATLMQACLLAGVFVPLLSFAFLVFRGAGMGARKRAALLAEHAAAGDDHGHDGHAAVPGQGEPYAGWFATGAIALSLVMALITLFTWLSGDAGDHAEWMKAAAESVVPWVHIGNMPIYFGVNLDGLTVAMFTMVTLCATCIHVFSIGYMKGEPRFARFFTYLSLFCFSMLGLVIARSLLFMFIFWELVGLCSYLLIGFWFEKKSASNAAIKAFVVNRVGDFGFMFGLAMCFIYLGSLSLDHAPAIFEAGAHNAGAITGQLSEAARNVALPDSAQAAKLFSTTLFGVPLATLMGIGLFCGAIGKSAQFPLHVWLPDAMEGPTPVSALIHAATMVAAGVYLVARVYTLLTPGAQAFIAVIGGITLTMAALIAIVQLDIKRVLAYSTLSQLGYMIFAMGVGAWIAALFHLITHAFFKALLFLGSGQVIIGCHHEQDMRPMGGLARKMPVTALTFLVAVLAISGVGIPWTHFGIGGFYSKDEILVVAHHRAFDWVTHGGAAEQADAHTRVPSGRDSFVPRFPDEPGGTAGLDPRGLASACDAGAAARRRGSAGMAIVAVSYPGSLRGIPVQEHNEHAVSDRPTTGAVAHGSSEEGAGGHGESPEQAAHGQEPSGSPAVAAHAGEHAAAGHAGGAHGINYAARYPHTGKLPFILFLLPVLIAYVTPFYMGRCFILTFLGRPRNQHIYDHATEEKLMYLPLVVLAVMTLIALSFRSLIAEAVPAGGLPALVPAIDGTSHAMHMAHQRLPYWVGLSWILGLGGAYLVYANGFSVAERVRRLPLVRPVYTVLWNKFYFDEIYGLLFVAGTKTVALVCRLFDSWIVDGVVNSLAYMTERVARFTGVVLDNMGVDGLVNLVGRVTWALGGVFRTVQTGVIRNYVLLAVIGISGTLICILSEWSVLWALVWVVLAAAALVVPPAASRRPADDLAD